MNAQTKEMQANPVESEQQYIGSHHIYTHVFTSHPSIYGYHCMLFRTHKTLCICDLVTLYNNIFGGTHLFRMNFSWFICHSCLATCIVCVCVHCTTEQVLNGFSFANVVKMSTYIHKHSYTHQQTIWKHSNPFHRCRCCRRRRQRARKLLYTNAL